MGKANFCFAFPFDDVKDNVCTRPLALVLYEVEVVVHDVPNYLFIWGEFCDIDGAAVNVSVMVLELADLVGSAFNFF